VQVALMFAIQYTIGMNDATANGVFGPGTQAGIKANVLSVGSSGTWVQLFSAAMVFNQRSGVSFTTQFDANLAARVQDFQSFTKLPVTGKGDFQTWSSLLVSTGDPTRPGTAADCSSEVTPDRADALKAAGYTAVGRYMCNVPGTNLNKMIQPAELFVLAAKGLRVFPIYQTFGDSAGYFSYNQGVSDGYAAIDWAKFHGFKSGTRIYFSVDFDAYDYEVTDNVIPHFRGVGDILSQFSAYDIGIYAPRNVCSRVAAEGLSTASFVSDMSTGYSGNLGYSLPTDWAFDTDNATLGCNTTTESFDFTMALDAVITGVARQLKMRKALIQCPILWELRKYNPTDYLADEAVKDHYSGTGVSPKDDSSVLSRKFMGGCRVG